MSGRVKTTYDINSAWLRGYTDENVGLKGGRNKFDVAESYERSAIAFSCIDRISKDIAGVPLLFLADPYDTTRELSDNDPLVRLFRRPSMGFTLRRLIQWTVMMHRLRGEAIWFVPGAGKAATKIIPHYDPRYWSERVNKDLGLYGWDYRDRQVEIVAGADEVLWVGQNSPSNPYRGISPLKAAAHAVGIDVYGDSLQEDMISRGGERGLVLSTEFSMQPEQYEQFMARLAMRRRGAGSASADFLVSGAKLENPDFTKEDIQFLDWQKASKRKICGVYGMAPSIIGDDDTAQFKSFPEARAAYWEQTIVPLVRDLEDAWDTFFGLRRGYRGYVRFDLSVVAALQDNETEKATIAKIYWDMGLGVAVLNERFDLGFDQADAEAADMLPRPSENLFGAQSQQDEGEQAAPPEKSRHKGLTNAVIKARASDARFRAQRVRRMARLERSTWNSIKTVAGVYQEKTLAEIRKALEEVGVNEAGARAAARAIDGLGFEFGNDLSDAVAPHHNEAAQIGSASVQELVDGKFLAWHDRVKTVSFAPNTARAMAERRAWLRDHVAPGWTDDIKDIVANAVQEAVDGGQGTGPVLQAVRQAWNGWGRSHAETIARTEVGTIYNTARVDEMVTQEFEHHEWVASIDESSRISHAEADGQVRMIVGETFNIGDVRMAYPQEVGAPAGEVINCRCETIPVVKDD